MLRHVSAVLLIVCVGMTAALLGPGEFQSKGKQLKVAQEGAEIYSDFALRGAGVSVTTAVPSSYKQQVLATFGDLACNVWKPEMIAALPVTSDRQAAERTKAQLSASSLLIGYIQTPTSVSSTSDLKQIYAYVLQVCEDRTASGMKELNPLQSVSQLGQMAEQDEDTCPNALTCEACTREKNCVWCGGSKNSTRYCKRGSIHGPADATTKRVTPFRRPTVTDPESCELTYQYGFCTPPGGCTAVSTCNACVASPLCVWCISTMKCEYGNRQAVHGDNGVCQDHVSKFKSGADRCPSPSQKPTVTDSSRPPNYEESQTQGQRLENMINRQAEQLLKQQSRVGH